MKKRIFICFISYGILMAQNEWDTVWTKTYGGADFDYARAVAVDSSGYYVIAGFTYSYGAGKTDAWIFKVNPVTSDTLWTRVYGDTMYDYAFDITVDRDGYYVVAGKYSVSSADQELWILKLNPQTGDTVWTKKYGGYYRDGAYGITTDQNGYYIVVGYTESYSANPDTPDVWILKLDPQTGDTIWTKTYGGNKYDGARAVAIDSDNYYIIGGYRDGTSSTSGDLWLLKVIPQTGDTVWTFNSLIYGYGDLYDIAVDLNNNYIIASYSGYSTSPTSYDAKIYKIDPQGNTVWYKYYDIDSMYQDAHAVVVNENNEYIITGTNSSNPSDLLIFKTSQTGDTLWTKIYGGQNNESAYDIVVDKDGFYVVVGYTSSYGAGYSDAWVLRLYGTATRVEEDVEVVSDEGIHLSSFSKKILDIYSGEKNLNIDIFSVDGRLISRFRSTDGVSRHRVKAGSGIYFIKGYGNKKIYNKKIIMIK